MAFIVRMYSLIYLQAYCYLYVISFLFLPLSVPSRDLPIAVPYISPSPCFGYAICFKLPCRGLSVHNVGVGGTTPFLAVVLPSI